MGTRVGLISDTHMPARWDKLPDQVAEVFRDVDLILHAGDVGELWVLDELSRIAPVVAVHGNDETPEAAHALPYQQTVSVKGVRILLCHSHQPDADAERAARRIDDWGPKLSRRAEQAAAVGARCYVYGHTHIPMCRTVGGVALVNPGAVASPNAYTRQLVQSVAVLEVDNGGRLHVAHHRVDQAASDDVPAIEWDRGFAAAAAQVTQGLMAPELEHAVRQFGKDNRPIATDLIEIVLRLARRCWAGEQQAITAPDLLREAEAGGPVELAGLVKGLRR